MMGHKICFYGEIWLIIPKLSLLPFHIWSIDFREHKVGGDKLFIPSHNKVVEGGLSHT